jgi:hypothetical protein
LEAADLQFGGLFLGSVDLRGRAEDVVVAVAERDREPRIERQPKTYGGADRVAGIDVADVELADLLIDVVLEVIKIAQARVDQRRLARFEIFVARLLAPES